MNGITANNLLAIAKKYLGYNTSDQAYEEIIKKYNKSVGGKRKISKDETWSAAFLSFCFAEIGGEKLIGQSEKDKEKLLSKLKTKHAYFTVGKKAVKVGDIVDFNSDLIGIVEVIKGRVITVIIGDKYGTVGRIRCLNNDKRIKGFARPKYITEKQATDEIAQEVILGKWGNGSAMVHKITAAGYDYEAIRRRVCELS